MCAVSWWPTACRTSPPSWPLLPPLATWQRPVGAGSAALHACRCPPALHLHAVLPPGRWHLLRRNSPALYADTLPALFPLALLKDMSRGERWLLRAIVPVSALFALAGAWAAIWEMATKFATKE